MVLFSFSIGGVLMTKLTDFYQEYQRQVELLRDSNETVKDITETINSLYEEFITTRFKVEETEEKLREAGRSLLYQVRAGNVIESDVVSDKFTPYGLTIRYHNNMSDDYIDVSFPWGDLQEELDRSEQEE